MNANRRKQLHEIADEMANLLSQIETLRDEEQDAYDAMPESFQDGEKGEKAQAAIDAMEQAIEELNNARDSIEIEATA